jgi:hypothetical protein
MFGLSQILETSRSSKDSLNRTDTGLDRRSKRILCGLLEAFAARNATLQHLGINQALIHAFARSVEIVSAFQFHCTRAFAA